ncbi:DUF1772 domain-containing protein [Allosaccharopolyspora coralli]|uniref:DUF1772 domain-containing protein n=1 Tax=Allosaccharopolyspora coralli TaxID=2665642 RepID=A0A5Q3QFH0_9PSEU|nr:DUF1772 domain-containing protein [Allosaccharopolyspora coralli]QGK69567.1 DUF1772 domain-containing protein [Allosaccharopolyspora coralli]
MTRSRVRRMLRLTQAGHLHGLVGDLYEAITRLPDRLAALPPEQRPRGPLGAGSPARRHLPAVPFTTPATVAAVVLGWREPADRPALLTTLVCSATATALTAHLVRTVNLPLLLGDRPVPSPGERKAILRRWHALNHVRNIALTGAVLAAHAVIHRQDPWSSLPPR